MEPRAPIPGHGSPNTCRAPRASRRENSLGDRVSSRRGDKGMHGRRQSHFVIPYLRCRCVCGGGGGSREVREWWCDAAIMIVSFDYNFFLSFFSF